MATSNDELNLDDVVQTWAKAMYEGSREDNYGSSQMRFGRKPEVTYRKDFSQVVFEDSNPTYTVYGRQSTPLEEVLYETTLRNKTSRDQEISFKVERETKAVGEIQLSRRLVADGKHRLNIRGLPQGVPSHLGFENEIVVAESMNHTVSEKMKWNVDTKVKVSAGKNVKAKMVVQGETSGAKFTVNTEIRGNVHVDIIDASDDNAVLQSIDGDIVQLLKHYMKGSAGLMFQGKKAIFQSDGKCQFRYGISTYVDITE